jgi:hypothetical protein
MQPEIDENITFSIKISRIEKSRDSHTTFESWKVQQGSFTYSKNQTGKFGNKPSQKQTSEVSDEKWQKMVSFIDEALLQDIAPPKQSEFDVPYSAIRLMWTIEKNGQSYSIELYDLASEMVKNPIYQKIERLTAILKN